MCYARPVADQEFGDFMVKNVNATLKLQESRESAFGGEGSVMGNMFMPVTEFFV